jgi:hypothetical protein
VQFVEQFKPDNIANIAKHRRGLPDDHLVGAGTTQWRIASQGTDRIRGGQRGSGDPAKRERHRGFHRIDQGH